MDVWEELAAIKKRERRTLDLVNRCLDRIEQLEWLVCRETYAGDQEQAIANLLDKLDANSAERALAPAPVEKGGTA